MDELVDHDVFHASIPLYTVANRSAVDRFGLLRALPAITFAPYGNSLPLFTDTDLAERFLVELNDKSLGVVELRTKKAVRETALFLQRQGVSYAAVDCSGVAGGARFYPLQEIIDAASD